MIVFLVALQALEKLAKKELKILKAHPGTSEDSVLVVVVFENNNQAAHGYVREHQSEYNTR